jgi:hypothetical protein
MIVLRNIICVLIIGNYFLLDAATEIHADKELLFRHVSRLVNTPAPRNYSNTAVLDTVAVYIATELKSYGFSDVHEQVYTVQDIQYKNVIASVGPDSTPRVIIGAHYDAFGDTQGADDNASGVAGLLETARLTYENRSLLKNKVEFAAYSLEEPPYYDTRFMGSYIHASDIADNGINVYLMICLEMIGYFTDEVKSQEYPLGILKPFYGSKGNFVLIVANFGSASQALSLNKVINEKSKITSKYIIAPKILPGVDFSDHRNFWGYGMDAVMVTNTAFYRNKNYHTIHDTTDKLDFVKMSEIVNGVVHYLLMLEAKSRFGSEKKRKVKKLPAKLLK